MTRQACTHTCISLSRPPIHVLASRGMASKGVHQDDPGASMTTDTPGAKGACAFALLEVGAVDGA